MAYGEWIQIETTYAMITDVNFVILNMMSTMALTYLTNCGVS